MPQEYYDSQGCRRILPNFLSRQLFAIGLARINLMLHGFLIRQENGSGSIGVIHHSTSLSFVGKNGSDSDHHLVKRDEE
jgi:hypothetical protein